MDFDSTTLILTTGALLLFFLWRAVAALKPPRCGCDTCRSYLSSSWTSTYNNLSDWYTHLLSQSPAATIHVHVLNNVITANPDNVLHILKTRFDNYPKGKQFSAILGDLLGAGIFNVDGHCWLFQRKIASLELGSLSVRSYAFQIVRSEIESRLLPLLGGGGGGAAAAVVDLQDIFQRFSFDSICRFSFGMDPGCLEASLPESEFAAAFDAASRLSAMRATATAPAIWKIKRFLNLGSERELKKAIRSVHLLSESVIRNKRKSAAESGKGDLLSRFMATINDDVLLRDIVISFLLAGRDTVAAALTGFFFLVSRNPSAVERIREESDRIMGEYSDRAVEFEELREMHFLQAAAHESMRLLPPVQFDSKFCAAADVLADGTAVARGTRVTYHPYAMGRMESVWGKDCGEFRPERWLTAADGVFRQESPYKFAVFQAGPRVCLGRDMAVAEMKAVALSVIRKFDFELVDGGGAAASAAAPRFAPGLTATFAGGLRAVVRERKRF
ncbi:cytochrome P450 94C1-like [Andrographis paniculata]|uniref:cytochrome P450 94C1-like n=1 Tax=Andrographis paniculata TaxID=175694 RepID=UPI0021E8328A|nr:cytochrome P450 94C1-like [Andrographis paniculata]